MLQLQDSKGILTANNAALEKLSTIIVTRIHPETEDEFILKLLRLTGSVKGWSRMKDPISGISLPTAKATMDGPLFAYWVYNTLNGVIVDGIDIAVRADERIHISKEEDLFNRTLELSRELAAERMQRRYANPFKAPRPLPRNAPAPIQAHEIPLDLVEECKTDALIHITRQEREFVAQAQALLQERAKAKGYSLDAPALLDEEEEDLVEGSEDAELKKKKAAAAEALRQAFCAKLLCGCKADDAAQVLSGDAFERFERRLEEKVREGKMLAGELRLAAQMARNPVDAAPGLKGSSSARERRRLESAQALLAELTEAVVAGKTRLKEDAAQWARTAEKKALLNVIDREELDHLLTHPDKYKLYDLQKQSALPSSASAFERRRFREIEIKADSENRQAHPDPPKRRKTVESTPRDAPSSAEGTTSAPADMMEVMRRLLPLVPKDDAAIFAFPISGVMRGSIMAEGVTGKFGKWIKSKLAALLGGDSMDLEVIVVETLQTMLGAGGDGKEAAALEEVLRLGLGDSAHDFVRRLWQMLIFEQLIINEKNSVSS